VPEPYFSLWRGIKALGERSRLDTKRNRAATGKADTYYAELVTWIPGQGYVEASTGGFREATFSRVLAAPEDPCEPGYSAGSARHRRAFEAAVLVVVALVLLAAFAARADAAAYYVGGGKGVKLTLRVVDWQIVWAKVRVEQHCYGSDRGYYHYTDFSEGLFGQVQIGRRGAFSTHSVSRNLGHKGNEGVSARNISGRIGPRRLSGKLLDYGWFTATESSGAHFHGRCWGASGSRPPKHLTPVSINARRRPEPPGRDFSASAAAAGITGRPGERVPLPDQDPPFGGLPGL
jgi:hypothetical protein